MHSAAVVELADALDSKSSGSDTVSVRPRSAAPKKRATCKGCPFFVPYGELNTPRERSDAFAKGEISEDGVVLFWCHFFILYR